MLADGWRGSNKYRQRQTRGGTYEDGHGPEPGGESGDPGGSCAQRRAEHQTRP
jgi:hypothetical protein